VAPELRGKVIAFLVTSARVANDLTFFSPALVTTVTSLMLRVIAEALENDAERLEASPMVAAEVTGLNRPWLNVFTSEKVAAELLGKVTAL